MPFSRWLANIATFVLVAVAVYFFGAALLAAWPMWAMMGLVPGWWLTLVLLAAGLLSGVIWLAVRSDRRRDVSPSDAEESCPRCQATVEPDYVLCPECHAALQTTCPECRRPLRVSWSRCPYCGAAAIGEPSARAQAQAAAPEVEQDARGTAKVGSDGSC